VTGFCPLLAHCHDVGVKQKMKQQLEITALHLHFGLLDATSTVSVLLLQIQHTDAERDMARKTVADVQNMLCFFSIQ